MRVSIRGRLLASYLGLIAVLAVTWAASVVSADTLRLNYTHTVNGLDALSNNVLLRLNLMDDEETGLRGYLLTRRTEFLQPYLAAQRALPGAWREASSLLHQEPDLRALDDATVARAQAWNRWARRTLREARTPTQGSSALVERQAEGKTLFDAYRAATARVTRGLDARRQAELRGSLATLTDVTRLFTIVFAAAIGLGALIGWRTTRAVTVPLVALERSAAAIGAGDLAQRITGGGAREFVRLAERMEWMRLQIEGQHAQLMARAAEIAASEERTRALYDELLESKKELERSNDELSQFAYVASHDLQEPLRTVASYTGLLRRRYAGKLDADADEFISYAVDGATRMQTLIQDLLAYSRVGNRSREPVPTECGAVVADALANLHTTIEECGARVDYDGLPTVYADGSQVTQLFQNLIGNALKFRRLNTDEAPRIRIHARRDGAGWTFAVQDNGIGIDPAYAGRIFVIFQRLHTREEYAGTGIGLAICKRIVERHGGRIWVESQPGQGATFLFTLPAAPDALASPDGRTTRGLEGEMEGEMEGEAAATPVVRELAS